jgi:hypothetical protein
LRAALPRLYEGIEYAFLIFSGDADSRIGYFQYEGQPLTTLCIGCHRDSPFPGVFHRVSDEVDQHLTEFSRIRASVPRNGGGAV